MELVQQAITIPKGTASVVLAPLGDIQWSGRREHIAFTHLQDHIKRAMERGAWFIGLGDYGDFASPSNRRRLANADLYDTAQQVIDDKARTLTEELYEVLLKPTTGRWLGLLEGHHYATLLSGETTDQYLCSLLKAPFLGTSAYVGLTFATNNGTRTFTIWLHHGAGGGQKAHAPLLKLENLSAYWDADLFLIGHMTKMAAAPLSRVAPVWNSRPAVLRERRVYLVGCGGWLKGYAERSKVGRTPRGGYVEQKMLNPVALGAPLVTITPRIRAEYKASVAHARYWEPEVRVEI